MCNIAFESVQLEPPDAGSRPNQDLRLQVRLTSLISQDVNTIEVVERTQVVNTVEARSLEVELMPVLKLFKKPPTVISDSE